jgi:Low-density lipoprotein receptor domain class A
LHWWKFDFAAARCSPDQFRCSDGSCHDPNVRCNGRRECASGEDEDNCRLPCRSDEFTCRSGDCIDLSAKCNGRPDCADGSDEEACGQYFGTLDFSALLFEGDDFFTISLTFF